MKKEHSTGYGGGFTLRTVIACLVLPALLWLASELRNVDHRLTRIENKLNIPQLAAK